MTPWGVALLVGVWIAIGLGTAVALSRRGHEFGPHAALGAVLGPLFVFLALDTIRRREHDQPIRISSSTKTGGKSVLVVAVGQVEDPETALAELEPAIGEIGPITVAVPVEHEVAERVRLGGVPPTTEDLDRMARSMSDRSPGTMLLPGRIDEAIPIGARETDADVVLLMGTDSASAAPGLEDRLEAAVVRVDAMTHPDSAAS